MLDILMPVIPLLQSLSHGPGGGISVGQGKENQVQGAALREPQGAVDGHFHLLVQPKRVNLAAR